MRRRERGRGTGDGGGPDAQGISVSSPRGPRSRRPTRCAGPECVVVDVARAKGMMCGDYYYMYVRISEGVRRDGAGVRRAAPRRVLPGDGWRWRPVPLADVPLECGFSSPESALGLGLALAFQLGLLPVRVAAHRRTRKLRMPALRRLGGAPPRFGTPLPVLQRLLRGARAAPHPQRTHPQTPSRPTASLPRAAQRTAGAVHRRRAPPGALPPETHWTLVGFFLTE